jgi:hypothetical protein
MITQIKEGRGLLASNDKIEGAGCQGMKSMREEEQTISTYSSYRYFRPVECAASYL